VFSYYLRLATMSLRSTPAVTGLMVATIGLGIAVFMAALTVYYLMASNPIPQKSDVLFAVQLDAWDPDRPWDDNRPEEPPPELTYRDAMAMRDTGIPTRRAAMHKVGLIVEPGREGVRPFKAVGRLTDGDFFAMFDIRFIYGAAWSRAADDHGELLVVLGEEMNDRVFGGEDSVGRTLTVDSRDFTVVGVIERWHPSPKFYDVNNGAFDESETMFVPLGVGDALEMYSEGNTSCWKDEDIVTFRDFADSECVWWQFWAELETPEQVAGFRDYMDSYAMEQQALGRFQRPLNNRLTDVEAWLDVRRVVRDDNKVLVGIAFLFLGVCLFNIVGLMLTKFLGKAPQTGIRRALGASRRAVLAQQLIEVGLLGAVGGLLGLALAWLALGGIKLLFPGFEHLAELDLTLAGIAILVAVVTTTIAGLYPVWRVCRVAPSAYLRLQ
jgi:putative ABC transport system permease protein